MLTWITLASCAWKAAAEALHRQSLIYFCYSQYFLLYLVFLTGADEKKTTLHFSLLLYFSWMLFITCTAAAAGSKMDLKRKILPWATDNQTQRYEKTMKRSNLLGEAKGKLRDEPEKHHQLGRTCPCFPMLKELLRIEGRFKVSGLPSRAPLPPDGWEAASEGHLDARAGRLRRITKWKIMEGVRLIKHFWAFKKVWGSPFSRGNALGQSRRHLSL